MHDNFLTPLGLKVRLNIHLLMSLIFGDTEKHSIEDINDNTRASACIDSIDIFFHFKYCLLWYFTIISICLKLSVFVYIPCSILLYICGILFLLTPVTFIKKIIVNIEFPFYITYKLFLIRWGVLIALSLILQNPFILLYFVIVRVFLVLLDDFGVGLITAHVTKRKYGVSYTDVEICAFRQFYYLMDKESGYIKEQNINKFSDLIEWYTLIVKQDEIYAKNENVSKLSVDSTVGTQTTINFDEADSQDIQEEYTEIAIKIQEMQHTLKVATEKYGNLTMQDIKYLSDNGNIAEINTGDLLVRWMHAREIIETYPSMIENLEKQRDSLITRYINS